MGRRSLAALLLATAGALACGDRLPLRSPPSEIETQPQAGPAPWTGTRALRDEGDFDFVVVGDRTIGHRSGVFEDAMPRAVNLLRPEFVLCVGDLIEGYTGDREQLGREWDEIEAATRRLAMPFFYVPGNHDLSDAASAEVWRARFGPSFYHFIYRNVLFLVLNSELFGMATDPDHPLPGPWTQVEQMTYVERALRENANARWTFVFVHQPFWDVPSQPLPGQSRPPAIDADWLRVEHELGSRPYTVFAGHFHRYTLHIRHGRQYISLASTGGRSELRGAAFGEFDQIARVKMTREGPVIANLRLDGILASDLLTVERREHGFAPAPAPAPREIAPAPPAAGPPANRYRPLERELVKALFCALLALGSCGFFAAAAGRSWETAALRRAAIAVTAAKPVLCLALYLSVPGSLFRSDAAIYYLPETLRFLSGQIPYRDFRSGYSPLFHLLLMPGVLAWPEPGSVVLTMLAAEIALVILYARRFAGTRPTETWRVLFLYCFSPISFYWVALTGYNSVLIALFALIALLLADARRDLAAGFAALLGLAFSKLTTVLAWPAIVFFPRGSVGRRVAPLLALLGLLPLLAHARIDILQDALGVRYLSTSGNLWFLVSLLVSGGGESRTVKLASMLSLLLAIGALVFLFLRRGRSREEDAFDRASALYSACGLVFMLLAYKTYPWYLGMSLIFLLHTLVRAGRVSLPALAPFALLGALTTFEPGLSIGLRSWLGAGWRDVVVPVDLAVIACLGIYAWRCTRIALGYRPEAPG